MVYQSPSRNRCPLRTSRVEDVYIGSIIHTNVTASRKYKAVSWDLGLWGTADTSGLEGEQKEISGTQKGLVWGASRQELLPREGGPLTKARGLWLSFFSPASSHSLLLAESPRMTPTSCHFVGLTGLEGFIWGGGRVISACWGLPHGWECR